MEANLKVNPHKTKPISASDKAFDIVNYILLALVLFVTAYPLYYVVVASVSDPFKVYAGQTMIYPVGFSWGGYQRIFQDAVITKGSPTSAIYTVVGTFVSVVLKMTYVGDVAHVSDLVAQMLQIAEEYVECYCRTCVTKMCVAIDSRAADIHSYVRSMKRFEAFFLAVQSIVYEQSLFHIIMRFIAYYAFFLSISDAKLHIFYLFVPISE